MRKSRLFIDVEQTGSNVRAPIYALTAEIQDKIFEELRKIGWEPQSYGNVDDAGAATCYIETPKRKEARYAATVEQLKKMGWNP